jgi:soluble lytic murein transglycosylase-like protein
MVPPIRTAPPVHETPSGNLHTLATQIAKANGLDPYVFKLIITNESHWHPRIVSPTGDYGIVQIHLAAHPEVTKAEAFDPVWSMQWMAAQWKAGKAREWTTYREYKASLQ